VTDESDLTGRLAAEPVRVARFDSLGAATDGGAPVAGFDDLDAAAGDRPVARVISFDSVADRRARRSGRPAVDPIEPDRSGSASRPDGPTPPADDGAADDGVAPDGPLPRGRRRRARVGRLGPDAPDPELPEPEADPAAIAGRSACARYDARGPAGAGVGPRPQGVPAEAAAEVLDRFARSA
jgi:hypothetical protein